MGEDWRDIPGYEGLYQVSSFGNVRSLDRVVRSRWGSDMIRRGVLLKQGNRPLTGYPFVVLCRDGVNTYYSVHRLVAASFVENPNQFPEVNHKDENTLNNYSENLEWCTSKYNKNYGQRNEKASKKLGIAIVQMDLNGNIIRTHNSATSCRKLGFTQSSIRKCCIGKTKNYRGFIWKYNESLNTAS